MDILQTFVSSTAQFICPAIFNIKENLIFLLRRDVKDEGSKEPSLSLTASNLVKIL